MQKPVFDKKTLDAAGQKLVKSQAVPTAEIDRVVGDPFLLARVKARIADAENARQKRSPAIFLHPKTLALTATGCLALLISAFVYLQSRPAKVEQDVAVSPEPTVTRPIDTPATVTSFPEPEKAGVDRKPVAQKAVVRKPVVRKTNAKRPKTTPDEDQFYAVAGVSTDSHGGGRIIRIEMSRSSLFALGVNLPLENDDQRPIKADLLIGRDGSTRAIRLVED